MTLYNNLPRYTFAAFVNSRNVSEVPRSSSVTNVLDNPDIALKNITIHNIPHNISYGIVLSPREKTTIDNVVTTNIINAFNAYRVLNSETISLRSIWYGIDDDVMA
jgi:hypothetical protein